MTAASKPGPAELWREAGGGTLHYDRQRYLDLLREHGHILGPGDEGYEDAGPGLPCDQPDGTLTRTERDAVLADLGQLLEVLGLGNFARPESPHEVMQQCIAVAAKLRAQQSEWLCEPCRTIHPWQAGDRLTARCPRCGSHMMPTSPALRDLEAAREEIAILRREGIKVAADEKERIAKVAEDLGAHYHERLERTRGRSASFADFLRGASSARVTGEEPG